jgi:hypothetical protein
MLPLLGIFALYVRPLGLIIASLAAAADVMRCVLVV